MLITIQNEKCVLHTLFHSENFNLLFCANSAITTLNFNKLLRKVQIPLKLGTTCLAIRSKDHSLQTPKIYSRMHRNTCIKSLWSRNNGAWSDWQCGDQSKVGLCDLRDLSEPNWFCDSVSFPFHLPKWRKTKICKTGQIKGSGVFNIS